MVFGEGVAQLKLIFPANIDAPHHADLLKHRNGAIDAGAVHAASGQSAKLAHADWFGTVKQIKYGLALFRQTIAVRFEEVCKYGGVIFHNRVSVLKMRQNCKKYASSFIIGKTRRARCYTDYLEGACLQAGYRW